MRKKFEKSRPMIKYFSLLMDHLALYIYIILIFIIFFSSSNQYFMNSTEHPPTLFSTCNQHCDCVDSEYHPVCAEFHDGKQTAFFSPCYAGCDKKYEPLQKVSFIKFSSYIFVIFWLILFSLQKYIKVFEKYWDQSFALFIWWFQANSILSKKNFAIFLRKI